MPLLAEIGGEIGDDRIGRRHARDCRGGRGSGRLGGCGGGGWSGGGSSSRCWSNGDCDWLCDEAPEHVMSVGRPAQKRGVMRCVSRGNTHSNSTLRVEEDMTAAYLPQPYQWGTRSNDAS